MILDSPYISGSTTIENSLTASSAVFSGNLNVTGDISSTGGLTGSLEGTASVALSAISSSHALNADNAISSSFAATSSFADTFTVAGEIVAQTLNVQQVTSSVVYSSGSNVFGNSVSNTQQFTGSLQVSGSTHYLLGNVGIGTNNPTTRLDINSTGTYTLSLNNTAQDTRIQLKKSGTEKGQISAGDSSLNLYGVNSLRFLLGESATERMLITSGGNVGIGTSTPVQKLHLYSTGSPAILYIESDASNNSVTSQISLGGVSPRAASIQGYREASSNLHALIFNTYEADPVERMRITSGGNVGIGTTSPVSAANYIFTTTNGTNGSGYITQVNGTTSMYVYSISTESRISEQRALPLVFETNGSEKMRITSGGNVGIGTTSPETSFVTYVGSVSNKVGIYLDTDGAGGSVGIGLGSSVGPYLVGNTKPDNTVRGEYGGSRMGFNANGFTFDYSSETSGARSWTNYMSINTSGNVGIGTTSPATLVQAVNDTNNSATFSSRWNASGYWSQLEIRNYSSYLNDQNNPQFKIMHNFNDGLNNGYVGFHRGSGLDGGFLSFGSNGTERVRIDTNGNVGIGTTSPSQKLEVSTSSGNLYIQTTASDGSNAGIRMNAIGQREYGIFSDGALRFYDFTASTDRMQITNTGHLLLKSTTAGGGTQGDFYIIENGGLVIDSSEGATQRYIEFTTGNTTKMLITAGGDVGIGTTSPAAKLSIAGDNAISGYSAYTLEFTTYFESGAHTLATLSDFSTGTSVIATMEYSVLYAYAGDTHASGIKLASTRRINNNTDWRDIDNANVSINGDTAYQPDLYWDNGVLILGVGSSVQVTARIRITAHQATVTRNYSAS